MVGCGLACPGGGCRGVGVRGGGTVGARIRGLRVSGVGGGGVSWGTTPYAGGGGVATRNTGPYIQTRATFVKDRRNFGTPFSGFGFRCRKCPPLVLGFGFRGNGHPDPLDAETKGSYHVSYGLTRMRPKTSGS